MNVLAISEKWSEKYGYDAREAPSIKYMKTKNFIIAMTETEEERKEFGYTNNHCKLDDIIELYNEMKDDYNIKIMIGKRYFFQDRMFCVINKSFEKFIRKLKKYYYNKLEEKKLEDSDWIFY